MVIAEMSIVRLIDNTQSYPPVMREISLNVTLQMIVH